MHKSPEAKDEDSDVKALAEAIEHRRFPEEKRESNLFLIEELFKQKKYLFENFNHKTSTMLCVCQDFWMEYGSLELFQWLYKRGCPEPFNPKKLSYTIYSSIDCPDDFNLSYLDNAAVHNRFDIMEHLVKNGNNEKLFLENFCIVTNDEREYRNHQFPRIISEDNQPHVTGLVKLFYENDCFRYNPLCFFQYLSLLAALPEVKNGDFQFLHQVFTESKWDTQASDEALPCYSIPSEPPIVVQNKNVFCNLWKKAKLDLVVYLHESNYPCNFLAMDYAYNLETMHFLDENRTEGCTLKAFDNAIYSNSLDILKFLVENRKTGWQEGCSEYALHYACENGFLEIIIYLHLTYPNHTGWKDALNAAIECGHLDVVKFIHENRKELYNPNAMDEAARCGYLNIVEFLHEKRSEGCTQNAMDEAASHGHLDVLSFLHENRSEGCTQKAMYEAIIHNKFEIVRFLLDKTNLGKPDHYYFGTKNNFEIIKYLINNRPGWFSYETINLAIQKNDVDLIKYLLESGHKDSFTHQVNIFQLTSIEMMKLLSKDFANRFTMETFKCIFLCTKTDQSALKYLFEAAPQLNNKETLDVAFTLVLPEPFRVPSDRFKNYYESFCFLVEHLNQLENLTARHFSAYASMRQVYYVRRLHALHPESFQKDGEKIWENVKDVDIWDFLTENRKEEKVTDCTPQVSFAVHDMMKGFLNEEDRYLVERGRSFMKRLLESKIPFDEMKIICDRSFRSSFVYSHPSAQRRKLNPEQQEEIFKLLFNNKTDWSILDILDIFDSSGWFHEYQIPLAKLYLQIGGQRIKAVNLEEYSVRPSEHKTDIDKFFLQHAPQFFFEYYSEYVSSDEEMMSTSTFNFGEEDD